MFTLALFTGLLKIYNSSYMSLLAPAPCASASTSIGRGALRADDLDHAQAWLQQAHPILTLFLLR